MTTEFKLEKKSKAPTIKLIPRIAPKDTRPVLGGEIIEKLYVNIGIIGRTGAGKTVLIYNLLMACAGSETTVIIYSSTWYVDLSWISVTKELKKHGITVKGYTSIFDDKGKNHLATFMHALEAKKEDKTEFNGGGLGVHALSKFVNVPMVGGSKAPSKFQEPKYIVVIDDLSDEVGSKTVTALLKKSRHLGMKLILSTQYANDISKSGRKMIGVWLILANQPVDKLETIHEDASLNIPFEQFLRLYKHATAKPYGFLMIQLQRDDGRPIEYRQNFTKYEL